MTRASKNPRRVQGVMQRDTRDLMRILSETHAMVREDGQWLSSTVKEAKFKSLDVTIEIRERA